MKFIVLIAVVLFVLWLMRGKRSIDASQGANPQQPAKIPPPEDMVACVVCSVHLPRTDALTGPDGKLYCCADHRRRAEA